MTVRILRGHCLEVMATLEPGLFHACVSSPPYWGLRDYGTPPVAWPAITYSPMPGLPACVEIPAMECSLGLEPTLEAFIGHIVLVYRQVRRLLRDDGTVWCNMGDSYAGSRCGGDSGASTLRNPGQKIDASARAKSTLRGNGHVGGGPKLAALEAARPMTASRRRDDEPIPRSDLRIPGLKPKDLVGQPWRVAFALQADGWWLRQDVIWNKLNPMPESVRDRCTKAHEYVFLLGKSERYYWDAEAMQEPASMTTHERRASTGVGFGHGFDKETKPRYRKPFGWADGDTPHDAIAHQQDSNHRKGGGRRPKAWDVDMGSNRTLIDGYARQTPPPTVRVRKQADGRDAKNNGSFDAAMSVMPTTRNKRSVWTVGTEPFSEAHFATFPPSLIEPCIKASCPIGGWTLDMFGGAATTGLVADRLQRNCVLIELNPSYADIGERRVVGDAPLFATVETSC